MKLYISLIFIFFILNLSCKNDDNNGNGVSTKHRESSTFLIADTIIYDVIVKNPNPNDKWTTECLQYFNKQDFVDNIFLSVYNKEVEAYDYFENRIIRPRKLKKLEETGEISREEIGKIQFTEKWYYDKNNLVFKKEILSLVFGGEIVSQDGSVRGYKPIFKVNLKN